ncbi:L-dopachrome tautomerase-related protein [Persicobacter psychrovividus]|uniref:DJ-1/PfpI domain-containing protein n=1 Tax=Persicobacter psychrovividus TaxID=387638 RepID=A0ABN6LF64_9BACT|nr:hypothetical protein PEPS_25780 [Persicobacter psychrovividus]
MKVLHFYLLALLFTFSACADKQENKDAPSASTDDPLTLVASSKNQWTGITISPEGRMFVNFPRWSDNVPISVGEIVDGKVVPFPNKKWNDYQNTKKDEPHFIAVQSVVADEAGFLWVLDPANPKFTGVDNKGPRIHLFHLHGDHDEYVKTIYFDSSVYSQNSYFNDLRINHKNDMIYITDSGAGGLIILDLNTGVSRKILANHPSTHAETGYLKLKNGLWKRNIHADGIALSPDKKHLYYAALSGHSLYRISTEVLDHPAYNNENYVEHVERIASINAPDGMMFDQEGNLYLGDLENEAIAIYKEGYYFRWIKDRRIRWADTFAKDSKGNMYFTTSEINYGQEEQQTYAIYKLNQKPTLPKSKGKILLAITSHQKLGTSEDAKKTGYYLSEVSHAYYTFKAAGYEVEFVSPKGGKSYMDGVDTTDVQNARFLKDDQAQQKINNSFAAQDIKPKGYRAIYYAGGHGTMWDFPKSEPLANVAQQIYENGGVVGAVCHGPAGLLPVTLSNGKALIDGKKVNGFTNAEEKAVKLDKIVPFLLEDQLKAKGGIFEHGNKWEEFSVADQRVITGQNPASAEAVAEKMVEWLAK